MFAFCVQLRALSLSVSALFAAQQSAAKAASPASAASTTAARLFDTPQQAADALVDAAEKFDVAALTQIFGPGRR